MDIAAEQQHAAWLRPDANRMGNGYEPPVGFPSEDISEMFSLQHGFDGNGSHMNRAAAANYYSQHSARAMGYGSTHSMFFFRTRCLFVFFFSNSLSEKPYKSNHMYFKVY